MRILLVDDEPLALRGLTRLLEAETDIVVVGTAANGHEALRMLEATQPDLIFLDIQMPGLSGLDVAAALQTAGSPDVIFVTAFGDYAADAFSVDAVDYLLKPVQPARLSQSLKRARRRQTERGHDDGPADLREPVLHLPDRHGGLDLSQSDIVWIEASRDYGLIHTERRTHIIRTTMAELADRLDDSIMRVHRSAFVSLRRVVRTRHEGKGTLTVCLDDGTTVQVGPTYAKAARAALKLLPRDVD